MTRWRRGAACRLHAACCLLWRCCNQPSKQPVDPCRPLAAKDKALLWRFRYALTSEPRALTKFLKCVDWSDASEARQASASRCGAAT